MSVASEVDPGLPRVAVAGATGFVGRSLVEALQGRAEIVALGRSASPFRSAGDAVRWRRCDLFSLRETETALAGVDTAYYLVHSMLPKNRLSQGSFQDLDLLLADNFGRAAAAAGVRRIIYLGGLVPDPEAGGEALSEHLASRLEVERALAGHGVPVTAVRAGLVVGKDGSSLRILVRLVRRLPAMLLPRWTRTRTQPIALDDVVAILVHCLSDEATVGRVCEVGGPDVMTYRDMMRETAIVLGRSRPMVPVPFFTPGLSRLWISVVTGTPRALIDPLIESLQHTMVVEDGWLQKRMNRGGRPFRESLMRAVRDEGIESVPTARSVQRLPLPSGRDASWVADEYAAWLPRVLWPFLRVEVEGTVTRIGVRGIREPLLQLELRSDRSGPDRALFEVSGGLLARAGTETPRLEFRCVPDGRHVLAAVQDFHPRLPWWLYASTQARLHVWVMRRFAAHLGRTAGLDSVTA